MEYRAIQWAQTNSLWGAHGQDVDRTGTGGHDGRHG